MTILLKRALDPLADNYHPPIILRKIDNYLSDLEDRRELLRKRHEDDVGYVSQGVMLLKQILDYLDLSTIISTWDNDLDRYLHGLYPLLPDIERIYDPALSNRIYDDLFIEGRKDHELIVPMRNMSPLREYPFDEPWSSWKLMRPLRMIDNDSKELVFDIYKDQVRYKEDPPSHAVFGLDAALFIMQYMKYLESDDAKEENYTTQRYIHKYIINMSFLEDLQDIWMRSRYSFILEEHDPFSKPEIFKKENETSIYKGIYGYIGLQYKDSMTSIYKLSTRVSRGTMTPNHLLASLPLSDHYLPGHYRHLIKSMHIPHQRQNYWTEFLINLPFIKLVYHAYKLNPRYVAYANYQRALSRDLDLLFKTRFWTSIVNVKTRKKVESELKILENFV